MQSKAFANKFVITLYILTVEMTVESDDLCMI